MVLIYSITFLLTSSHHAKCYRANYTLAFILLPVQPQNQDGAGSIDMSQRQGDMERMGGNRSILRDSVL